MLKQILLFSFFQTIGLTLIAQKTDLKSIWRDAEKQLAVLLKEAKENRKGSLVFPRTLSNDSIKLVASNDWTSGFFPGMLWMMYDKTGKAEWKTAAQEFTSLMNKEPYNRKSHDVGFKVYNSYGQGYRLTKDTAYKRLIIDAAKTLASRFHPTVGCIRSWDFGKWQYPVIIDNMMNLELLFAATRLSGDSSFYNIAVAHANTTAKHHFRQDYSSYHVVDYDTTTGEVRGKGTHQGYADESSWARGQAWALYGYTMCYRETGNKTYLDMAENVATFILNHPSLPKDGIPYWDFNAPSIEKEPRDASAAAIIASALFELSQHSKKKKYLKASDKIFQSLVKYYRAKPGEAKGFLLLHSTGHKPANGEVDVPLIYADYYFLETLKRREGGGF
jgi:unsaturated chondroitin disaccharide hydrolase